MRISVIGTGYLGACHAVCLAELGFEVLGVDRDSRRIAALNAGFLPFSEPGLDELLVKHVQGGRLRFTTSIEEAAAQADLHFICVGTPQCGSGEAADVTAVLAVAVELARRTPHDCLLVGKSTVPVGTTRTVRELVAAVQPPGLRVGVAWSPEFIREGRAVEDTLRPDRLVFGVDDARDEARLRQVYAGLVAEGRPVHVTTAATAELAKVAANAFLAAKISFVNAMADVCERSGTDVVALADILGDDARIGRAGLDAGLGFGGGCLPKDVRALAARATELGADSAAELLHHVDRLNLDARRRTVELALQLLPPGRYGGRVAVLGASFKPHSDDVRDSPALAVAEALRLHGFEVSVHDPAAMANARAAYPLLHYAADVDAVLEGADLTLHLTQWPQFAAIDPARAARIVRAPRLVDGRNALDHDAWRRAGWTVLAPGRPRDEAPVPDHAIPAGAIDAPAVR